MNNEFFRKNNCRLCGSKSISSVVKLKPTPPANAFVKVDQLKIKQKEFPLELFFCNECSHVQLIDVVDPSLLFENYVYVSGTSPLFIKHFKNYAEEIINEYNPCKTKLVVDIGSNDGTLLQFFKSEGFSVLGVDPAKDIAQKATKDGIATISAFFTEKLAETICSKNSSASVITANNVFAHADDLKGILSGVRRLLAPNGIFIFEVSYLVDVFEKTLFDTIYHEHLSYHSVKPLKKFFSENGMELIDAQRIETHGGSLRGIAQLKNGPRSPRSSVNHLIELEKKLKLDTPKSLYDYGFKINSVKKELGDLLKSIKSEGKKIAGFGAPAKATTLMYQFELGPDIIDFIVDDSPLKQGLFTPGLHIPVVPSYKIKEEKPDYLLILAWNFANSIIQKNKDFHKSGGQFIIPLPTLQVI